MATDTFLQIDGLKGESTDGDHKDWIEILSWSHAVSQNASASVGSAGGGTVGRTKHEDFVISKYIDLSSPKLHEMCSSGKHIKKVVLEAMRASGDKRVKYWAVEMDQVIVSKVAPALVDGNDLPVESVSFNYGAISWTYTKQTRDGAGSGNTSAGWDLAKGATK